VAAKKTRELSSFVKLKVGWEKELVFQGYGFGSAQINRGCIEAGASNRRCRGLVAASRIPDIYKFTHEKKIHLI
jgi:hypothetical protein